MMESIGRKGDVKNKKSNEESKMVSIIADFGNYTSLVQRNYKARSDDLRQAKEEKEDRIKELEAKLEEMKTNHNNEMEARNKTANDIKTNMDSLSTFFSTQLTEIQTNLQGQINKISAKWETNFTEHMEKYKDHVKKYDVYKDKNEG